jgi:hypothetical protein
MQTEQSNFDSSNSAANFIKFQNHLFTPLVDIKGLSPNRVEEKKERKQQKMTKWERKEGKKKMKMNYLNF